MANLIKSNNANIKIFGGKLSAAPVNVGGNSLLTGLQAFYKLSDLTDSSGNNLTLTNNGNVSFASGKIGDAAVFDGSNALVAPLALDFSNDKTISCWVNGSDAGYGQILMGQYNYGPSFNMYLLNGNINLDDFTQNFGINYPFTTNSWQHIVVTTSSGTIKLFVNGILQSSVSNYLGNIPCLSIGAEVREGSLISPFNGQIDAVGVWNRALSDAEVAALYNSGNGLELN
jgi:hypothetical protein